jgi:hypothetical protein
MEDVEVGSEPEGPAVCASMIAQPPGSKVDVGYFRLRILPALRSNYVHI